METDGERGEEISAAGLFSFTFFVNWVVSVSVTCCAHFIISRKHYYQVAGVISQSIILAF